VPQFPRRSATSHVTKVFLPFAMGYFLSYLFRTINGPIADRLIAAFHLNPASLGLLTSVYFLTFAACQLPYGPLVDRFGPCRVQASVLGVAVLGATLFATAPNTPILIFARALIGIGTSGALMAGLKALALWVPQERRALANGCFIMFGGLGAMTSTVPVNLLLPFAGWRGVFLLLAVFTLASALLVLVVVPEKRAAAPHEDWRRSLDGLLAVYREPMFWRLAPLSGCVIGTAFAVHGLWAARWLADVDHFSPDHIFSVVFAMGAGLTLGAAVIGIATDRLRRRGIPTVMTFGLACALFIGLQVMVLERLPVPAWLQWSAIASFGSMTVLSYSIMGELFPSEQIGRANGALNVLHLSMAFVLQYGMGLIAALWHRDEFGHLPVTAYRAAFALPLLLEVIALGWLVISVGGEYWRNRRHSGCDKATIATEVIR
jgi:MFS family permease